MKKKGFFRRLALTSFALAVVASPLTITGAVAQEKAGFTLRAPEQGFRVLPYLQSPASTSMTISWVSELNEPGTVRVSGPGMKAIKVTSTPKYMDLMEYTEKELNQELNYNAGNGIIESLPQGSWLESNANYKHTVTIEGLKPNTKYQYQVKQGKKVHNANFKTSPDREKWDKLRLIAFSDTETEPFGALEHREWELHTINPYAPGSEERPGKGSAFDQKYGNQTRNGMSLVRYPLDQQTALNENLCPY